MTTIFTCEECNQTYEKGWTDEEAKEEAESTFGISTGAVVCDDCYNQIMYNRAKEIPVFKGTREALNNL